MSWRTADFTINKAERKNHVWTYDFLEDQTEKGCKSIFITPGNPWENAYIESFNGKFRDECLNCELFYNGRQAQIIAENWRVEYNTYRPHSSLGYMTPEEFASDPRNSVRPTVSLYFQNRSQNQGITENTTKF